MTELEFANLNNYSQIEFLTGDSPEQLKAQLLEIKSPIKILHMYSSGSKHYVWFLSQDKINKVKKRK